MKKFVKMKSAPKGSLFDSIRSARIPQTRFSMSYSNSFSSEAGFLIPSYLEEVCPGDKIKIDSQLLLRTQPLIAPIYSMLDVEQRFFFVPYRILWDHFEDFRTGGVSGNEVFEHPRMAPDMSSGSLADYLGYPEYGQKDGSVNALFFRAYALIYNEYFRDENVQNELPISYADGLDTITNYNLAFVDWRKDYFTSALPFQQRGTASMFEVNFMPQTGKYGRWVTSQSGAAVNDSMQNQDSPVLTHVDANGNFIFADNVANQSISYDPNGTLVFNLQSMREANAIQRFMEAQAVGGGRFTEFLRNVFGVTPLDSRLQRPEYLGGGSTPLTITAIENTAGATNSPVQGNLSGKGTASGVFSVPSVLIPEDGVVLGVSYIRPNAVYWQGLKRTHEPDRDKFSYYNPFFANLGEQEVKVSELYYQGNANYQQGVVFGYQSRYAHMKHHSNEIHGDFRSTLNYWTMSRNFPAAPSLNDTFLRCNASKSIFPVVVSSSDGYLWNFYHNVEMVRPMPQHPVPSLDPKV